MNFHKQLKSAQKLENRETYAGIKKKELRYFKNTMELMYKTCIELIHNHELKTKKKMHQRIKKHNHKTGLK